MFASRWFARSSLVQFLVLVPSLAAASVPDEAAPVEPQGIYGGQLAGTCEWPSNVIMLGAYGFACSGSLVHPEIVVSASHCLEGGPMTAIGFGEDAFSPHDQVPIAQCVQHPNYQLDYPDYNDFMYCRLAQPVVGVPIVPILMGCETDRLVPGAPAVLAGYGEANDGLPEGRKRYVTTSIEDLWETRVFFAGGTGKGTCSGDSGGPSYFELEDGSWRVFGTTTGGPDCGDWGQSELIHLFVPWIEQQTGIDITPCHDADGTWAPSAECGAFPAAPDVGAGTWGSLCGGGPVTALSNSCGPAFGEDDPSDDDDDAPTGEGGDAVDDDDDAASDSGDEDQDDDEDDDDGPMLDAAGDAGWPSVPRDPDDACACTNGSRSPTWAWAILVGIALRRRRHVGPRRVTSGQGACAHVRRRCGRLRLPYAWTTAALRRPAMDHDDNSDDREGRAV